MGPPHTLCEWHTLVLTNEIDGLLVMAPIISFTYEANDRLFMVNTQ